MCPNDFKGKGQLALAVIMWDHAVSLWSTVISFSFMQFIYLLEKEKFIYIQTFNILQKCYLKIKET